MRRPAGACAALSVVSLALFASVTGLITPVGRWRTIDDKTGNPKAIVEIYTDHNRLFGRIVATLDPKADKFCTKCKDERKGQPIVGMVIMRGLAIHGEEYTGGDILDPDNGSVYRCKLRMQEGGKKLLVRGYLGFSLLGRTQTWTREPDTTAPATPAAPR